MPIVSDLTITSVAFDPITGVMNITGIAFGENQYPISAVLYRKHGEVVTASLLITSYSDSLIIGTVVALPLSGGRYDVMVINSDNESSAWAENAFQLPTGVASQFSNRFGIGGMGF